MIVSQSRLSASGFETAGDIRAVPDHSQHAIYSFNVLEHIEDDEAVLRDLFRVAAPGAQLLLYVPAFPVLFSAMDKRVDTSDGTDDGSSSASLRPWASKWTGAPMLTASVSRLHSSIEC